MATLKRRTLAIFRKFSERMENLADWVGNCLNQIAVFRYVMTNNHDIQRIRWKQLTGHAERYPLLKITACEF